MLLVYKSVKGSVPRSVRISPDPWFAGWRDDAIPHVLIRCGSSIVDQEIGRMIEDPSTAAAGDHGSGRIVTDEPQLLYNDLSGTVIGAFYRVYNDLKWGHLESVYANALAVVLRESGLRVKREAAIEVVYHGPRIGFFRADLLVEGRLIAEAKTADDIVPAHLSQVINYLRSSDLELGLVLCFGQKPVFRRVLLDNDHKPRWRQGGAP